MMSSVDLSVFHSSDQTSYVTVFQVGQGYPHDPPKVKCETMVYHPNIDLEGNVCLNILRSVDTAAALINL